MSIRYFHLTILVIKKKKGMSYSIKRLFHIRIRTIDLRNRSSSLINLGCSILRVNFRRLLRTGLPICSGRPGKVKKASSIFTMLIGILWRKSSLIGRIIHFWSKLKIIVCSFLRNIKSEGHSKMLRKLVFLLVGLKKRPSIR